MIVVVTIVAAMISFVIGGVWFSPKIFYKQYAQLLNKKEEDIEKMRNNFNPILSFGLTFLSELLIAMLITWITISFSIVKFADICVILIGAVVLSNIKTNIFGYNNAKFFLIVEGQKIVSLLAMISIIFYTIR